MTPVEVDDAMVLWVDYKYGNTIAADAKYKNKLLTITGIATEVGTDYSGDTYLKFGTDIPSYFGIYCTFKPEAISDVAAIIIGHTVTIQGICMGYSGYYWVYVEDCIVINNTNPTSTPTLTPTHTPTPTSTPMPTSTPTPTPTPIPTTTVLFSDDFSDPNSGWRIYDGIYGQVGYENGYYYVEDSALYNGIMWGNIQLSFSDFILEIETWLIDGTDYNWQSVSCRVQDDYNYYSFGISAGGGYLIEKVANGEQVLLRAPVSSSYINQGVGAVNLIHIECIGSSLSFSVNGHLLAQVTDNALSSGSISLDANAKNDTFTKVAFDNLVITEP